MVEVVERRRLGRGKSQSYVGCGKRCLPDIHPPVLSDKLLNM